MYIKNKWVYNCFMLKNIFSKYALLLVKNEKIELNFVRFIYLQTLYTIWILLFFYLLSYWLLFETQLLIPILVTILFFIVLVGSQYYLTPRILKNKFDSYTGEELLVLQKKVDVNVFILLIPFMFARMGITNILLYMSVFLVTVGFYGLRMIKVLKNN